MKKKFVSLLLALVICLGLLPVTAAAAEAELPDWYFLFAIFKNVDADGYDKDGKAVHVTYSMSQVEVDTVRDYAREFEAYMNQHGVIRAHVDVVEIDATVTELQETYLGAKQAAPLLEGKVDLDRYDHVSGFISLDNLTTTYLGITVGPFENGTGLSCINFINQESCLKYKTIEANPWVPGVPVHEFLHFMEILDRKWGWEFDLHDIMHNFYELVNGEYEECYTDILLNRAKGTAGTGVHPFAWQYPPHVLRTMTELNVPSGVTSIGDSAFMDKTALTKVTIPDSVTSIGEWAFGCYATRGALERVSIPASVTSIGYAAFYNSSLTDVYYSGTEAQWQAIQMGEYNETLTRANIHYNHLMADVKTDDWFARGVTWAVENGITAGTGGGGFSPNSTCSQAQILTFLWRANGSPEPTGNVSGGEYYAVPLQWAGERGIISGSLDPNSPCTRSDVVTYLWKLAGSPAARAASFSDVPASAGYANAVSWAVEQGITSGTGAGKFSPDSPCTRGQIVTFLRQALAG